MSLNAISLMWDIDRSPCLQEIEAPWTPSLLHSRSLGLQFLLVWVSEFLVLGSLGPWFSGSVGLWVPESLGFRVPGSVGPSVSCSLGCWISGMWVPWSLCAWVCG